PLLLGGVTIGLPRSPSIVQPGSIHVATFAGRSSIAIPPGAPVLSDSIPFAVVDGAEITISFFFPKRVRSITWHELAIKTAVVAPPGDYTHADEIRGGKESPHSILVSAVLVPAQPSARLIVAFGDSIVDGDGSTLEKDRNWPADLVRRLETTGPGSKP